MNLFAGQKSNRFMDMAGDEGESEMYGDSNLHYHMKNRYQFGIRCMVQGTLTGALQQPRGVQRGGRWKTASVGGGICISISDSC